MIKFLGIRDILSSSFRLGVFTLLNIQARKHKLSFPRLNTKVGRAKFSKHENICSKPQLSERRRVVGLGKGSERIKERERETERQKERERRLIDTESSMVFSRGKEGGGR